MDQHSLHPQFPQLTQVGKIMRYPYLNALCAHTKYFKYQETKLQQFHVFINKNIWLVKAF